MKLFANFTHIVYDSYLNLHADTGGDLPWTKSHEPYGRRKSITLPRISKPDMPSLILSTPFFLIAAILLYLVYGVSESYAPLLVAPFVCLAAIFVFSPQINWWWFKRHPPDLAKPLRPLIAQSPYYRRLSEKLQLRFRQKVNMLMIGTDYKKPTDEGGVPEDIKAAVAGSAVPLLLGLEDLLFPPFEYVVVYATPFPSPQYPTKMHLSEIYEEDGVVLFSAEHLLKGFLKPEQFFPIGMYEYARIFLRLREKKNLSRPGVEENAWQALESMSGYSRARIAQWINLNESDIDLPAVAVVHFFIFPERFRELLPALYEAYCKLFQQNPLDFAALERRFAAEGDQYAK
mgnify:CR=1 FL=1